MLTPTALRCDYRFEPPAVQAAQPRFTWELDGRGTGLVQSAYQIVVTDSEGNPRWDSGRVASRHQHALYRGRALPSRIRCVWSVAVWEGAQRDPGPAATSTFKVGLRRRDWRARWISDPERLGGANHGRPSLLRHAFKLAEQPAAAWLYATARGLYRLEVNGRRVGDALLRPGWTDYRRRLQYQVYDVASLLGPGRNVIGAELADGWYSGRAAWRDRWYGDHPSLLIQCEVDAGGRRMDVLSGAGWEAAWGPTLASDLQLGETFDARARRPRWSSPGDASGGWRQAVVEAMPVRALVPDASPVRRVVEVPARDIHRRGDGSAIYDFGQNLAGRLRIEAAGRRGARVRMRHAEMLAGDGSLYTENLRGAACTDEYVLGGSGAQTYEPEFTYRGFRYAELSGAAEVRSAVAVVTESDLREAAAFECSHELINRLHANIVWSQRGNFVDIPTDCPQRDERLGWAGDVQVFAPTACMNQECAVFLGEKWLQALVDAQRPDGAFPDVAPLLNPLARDGKLRPAAPGWGDAGVIVPHLLYLHYGDERLLRRMYRPMRRWIEYVHRHNPKLLWLNRRGDDYGDWLALDETTPKEVVATAYFARSAALVATAATLLGDAAESARIRRLASRIRRAFQQAYVSADGVVLGDTQTAYVLALAFDLVPDGLRESAAAHLLRRLDAGGGRLRTGFLGVGLLLPVLESVGQAALAQRLLVERGFPSWGYSIERGATTIWERWNGWTEEGGFANPFMNSFNHYALGSVGAWIYAAVGGLAPDPARPGWARAIVRPLPNRDLGITSGRARHHSIRGPFDCSWRLDGPSFEMDVEVPPNASALVYVPGAQPREIGSGRHHFSAAAAPA